jgi:HAD superfamily hydrolase (TIGR01509 family)
MKNIKTIIFDLGAVLLNINYQLTITEFAKLGVKNTDSFYSKEVQTNLFNDIESGKISADSFLKLLQKETKNASKNEVRNAWNAMLIDLPKERIELLKQLKQDFPIYLLSNTNSIHISEFRKKIGETKYQEFYNLFDKVYYSHEIGFRKPNKEAFQIILDENNFNANEVLFIDDSPQHIEGAKNLGIKTYHLKDSDEVTTLFPDIAL